MLPVNRLVVQLSLFSHYYKSMWSGKIPHVIYYTLRHQHAWRREIVALHNNHTRLGTVTLPLFHHMSNMTPKEVEEHCSSYDTWGVLGSWFKGTEGQIALMMNMNAKKTASFSFLCSPKKWQILQSLCKVFWELLKEFCTTPRGSGLKGPKIPGGDSAYGRGGDARRKFWIKPLRETDLGVAQACFDP